MGRNRLHIIGLCSLLFLFVFTTTQSVEAEQATFKIPDYIPQKFTDLRLQITGGASSSNRNSSSSSVGDYWEYGAQSQIGEGKSSNRYHHLDLGSSGEYRYETVPFRLRCGATLSTSLHYSKNKDQTRARGDYYESSATLEDSHHCYSVSARPFLSGLKYIMRDFFATTDSRLNLSYSHEPREFHDVRYDVRRNPNDSLTMGTWFSSSDSKARSHQFSFLADLSGSFGYGHIYEGWYAATSLYIIDELRTQSLLESEPTSQQMMDLSALVHQNALQHAIDNRVRFIESMQTILGYLEQQGILKQGFSSTLIVQDVWNYFPRTSRRFGWQVSIGSGLTNDYARNDDSAFTVTTRLNTRYLIESPDIVDTVLSEHTETASRQDAQRHSSTAYMQLRTECHAAIDLRWQFDTDLGARYYLRPFRWSASVAGPSGSKNQINYDDYVTLDGAASLTYIINSRTNAMLWGQFSNESYKLTTTEGFSGRSVKRSLHSQRYAVSLQITYRLSIPTALSFSLNYDNQQYPQSGVTYLEESTYESYSASVNISHYLF
jgi:hypothetical protein